MTGVKESRRKAIADGVKRIWIRLSRFVRVVSLNEDSHGQFYPMLNPFHALGQLRGYVPYLSLRRSRNPLGVNARGKRALVIRASKGFLHHFTSLLRGTFSFR
jgi:hypothetical protein